MVNQLQISKYYFGKPSLNLIYDEINKVEKEFINKKQIILPEDYQIESINLKNVSFCYENNKTIFNNINKKIKKSSSIGITGDSGVGKTTLIHLLSGILKPVEGEILVDEYNLGNLNNWTDKIAYVSQKPFIMDSSIRENVCLGDKLDTIGEKKLNDIYSLAGLDNFIENLKLKDLSQLGESGNLVSGGQIQRIGIARALYKKAQIFLLDEITSNLDENVKIKILQNLIDLKSGRIIFLISHDKKILEYCDDFINL